MNYLILYYLLSTILYVGVGQSHVYWFLFNMVSILFVIVGLLYNLGYRVAIYKPFLSVAIAMTICRIVYSFACVIAPYKWVQECNTLFAIIFIIWTTTTIITRYRGI